MRFLILAILSAFLFFGCANKITLNETPKFSQKHFLVETGGVKSQIFVRKDENLYHFVWLDMLKAPIARKFLKLQNCDKQICAQFENDGFLPPNKGAENLFLNLLQNIEKDEFELNLQGQIYKVLNANLSK